MAREMKDSGIEWIGEIPREWEIARLKTLFSFGKGLPITKENLCEYGVPVISYGQIHSKTNTGVKIQNDLIRYVSESYLETNKQSLVDESDFIFADTSEDIDGCGNCVYVDSQSVLFAGYHTIILHSRSNGNNRFLAYLFKTDNWRSQIRGRVSGVKVFSISRRILSDAAVLLPPVSEQQSIADFLDTQCAHIDFVIEKTHAAIEEYKKLKQAVITQAVTKGIRPNREMKDSGIEWIGEIPKEWSLIRIKRLLNERNERSVSGNEEPLSMSQKYGLIPTSQMDMIPNIASSFVGAKLCYKNDLVFNKLKAHLGVFAVSNFDGLVSPDYAVYYSTNIASLKYLEFLFKTPQYIGEFRKKSTGVGAGLTRLYTSGLYSIYCALPDYLEQSEIVAYLDEKNDAIDSLIQKKEQLIAELEAYKKSLIYEYVTGKKEVV